MTDVIIRGGNVQVRTRGVTQRVTLSRATVARIGAGMGAQGPPGADGETEGATFTATAGSTIFGGRVVRIVGGEIFHPDLLNNDHAAQVVGIATQSGSIGVDLLVRSGGTYTDGALTLVPGTVWCGVDGQLTQSPGATGWLVPVGRVLSPTSFAVDVEPAIYRS